MKSMTLSLSFVVLSMLLGCSMESPSSVDDSTRTAYFVLDDQLARLKADFNAMEGKIRLVFISGPSCGICLRGLDDLNNSIVAAIQRDPRIHTFVIHVPTLGAEEKHAAASVTLMEGPRVTHYWDESGQSGLEFQEALDISFYAWDVWMIYEAGARWEQKLPAPNYWEHQLVFLPKETLLDASRFADAVRQRLSVLPPASEAARTAEAQLNDPQIMRVAQPRGVMIEHNHRSRGGYQNLKRIAAINYDGVAQIDDRSYSLKVETRRPHHYRRVLDDGEREAIVSWDGTEATRQGELYGLPAEYLNEVLTSYHIDGLMTDFKINGNQVWRLGMKKLDDRLPWLMEAELANGRTWHIYVDSHTGDAFRATLLDSQGEETIALEYSDYKDVDGYRLPHRIQYFDGGRLLATDRFDKIEVQTMSPDTLAKGNLK